MGFMSHGRISSGTSTSKDKPAEAVTDKGRCYCSKTCGGGPYGDGRNAKCKKHSAYHVFGKGSINKSLSSNLSQGRDCE